MFFFFIFLVEFVVLCGLQLYSYRIACMFLYIKKTTTKLIEKMKLDGVSTFERSEGQA